MATTPVSAGCEVFHAFNTGWAAGYHGADFGRHWRTVIQSLDRGLTKKEFDDMKSGYEHGRQDRTDFDRRMKQAGESAISDASYMRVPMVMAKVPEAPSGATVTWAGVNIWGGTPHLEMWARRGNKIYVTEFNGDGEWTPWRENCSIT